MSTLYVVYYLPSAFAPFLPLRSSLSLSIQPIFWRAQLRTNPPRSRDLLLPVKWRLGFHPNEHGGILNIKRSVDCGELADLRFLDLDYSLS